MRDPGARASSTPLVGGSAEPTLRDLSAPGRQAWSLPDLDVPRRNLDLPEMADAPPALPEVAERDLVAHFTRLAHRNFGVDLGAYPLGSCTMKYNPKVCDWAAELPGFRDLHPSAPAQLTQGILEAVVEAERILCELTGMSRASFQPPAGAAGELTGLLIMRAYHQEKGHPRHKVVIPDASHGTNPASVTLAGYEAVSVPSNAKGMVDIDALRAVVDEDTAGLMLTNPNTLGLFEEDIEVIAQIIHEVDGLVYYDGANLNAILGVVRPGDMGFDIVHSNLHKTFATPHGGGGPGSGPVGVVERLVPYLPVSIVREHPDGSFYLDYDQPKSIGYMAPFYGNFSVILRAYAYILMLGGDGLRRVSENAVLNANYILTKLKPYYDAASDKACMHECTLSASRQKEHGVNAMDIAKALIDRGFHPPTVYFPLTVDEAIMIEPTETESKETLDTFIDAMIEIAKLVETDPESITRCPTTTPVGRLDQVAAARKPDLASLA